MPRFQGPARWECNFTNSVQISFIQTLKLIAFSWTIIEGLACRLTLCFRMQRVNLHARPSYYSGGVPHLMLSGVCTEPCKSGLCRPRYSSEPCHRNRELMDSHWAVGLGRCSLLAPSQDILRSSEQNSLRSPSELVYMYQDAETEKCGISKCSMKIWVRN